MNSTSPTPSRLLVINAGSSSIRWALYEEENRFAFGKGEYLTKEARWVFESEIEGAKSRKELPHSNTSAAVDFLLTWLETKQLLASVTAIGHRLVHGMERKAPALLTPALLEELTRLIPYDPEHLPLEITLIKELSKRYPALPQVACFDTAFHHEMPKVATLLPIPRRYMKKGMRRYGFHGLSYEFLMNELRRLNVPAATKGRVILAHLGNGASLAAVRDGKSVDTSMGFTPTSGCLMSSRSGDLDPGIIAYLSQTEQMSIAQFQKMVTHYSGLLGVSEISSDMRVLLDLEKKEIRAAEAIALFCYQVKKWIGSFSAILEGLDLLVFAGGIGENSAIIRTRICQGLQFLGIEIDEKKNNAHETVISSASSKILVFVLPTNEELMIAQATQTLLCLN